ncbi:Tyramine beta-hydroxylase [Seminavis robusta]|uniref:Tyramine beta-hydroxylase n=1 Tax=Seminavis robusta TaxID=568900 RepID=A0A9N8DUC5_9STRA|nr:Tyramine beta-hydroxylase [Seminavis robusta]|eukprot:Sro255_g100270.1 Tyramine beta-hydroxylase (573) ;mRNA; f:7295-9013
MNLSLAYISLFLSPFALARPDYAARIPNGRSVPHPGPQGGVWAGVGHDNAAGGGARNPFGLDFASNGFEWTIPLCEADSDGDGRSNGEELGDPSCEWSPGEEPAGPALSHPGIVDNPKDTVPNPCESYEAPPDVQVLDINFTTANEMNASRTHYRCEQLVVESPDPLAALQQIKTEALVDNPNVLHHMWIYHCMGQDSSDGNKVGQGSYECSGMESNCQIVAGWAVGPTEWCEHPNVGSYIEFFTSSVFKVEAHYDNSQGIAQSDQSGMRLSFTATPRPLTGGLSVLGMSYWDRQFLVPKQQESFALTNLCPSTATQLLSSPMWVYSWNPHMHLYGKTLVTEHYRCGVKIGEIGRIEDFEFDNQQSYHLDPPVKILPGDALVTTCTYDTTTVDQDVPGGESTSEEMCDNYLTYFPYIGTDWQPNLFSACNTFPEGENPRFAGYDDSTPFGTVDLGGDVLVWDWQADATNNVGECCATSTCDTAYLSNEGDPCGMDSDCVSGSTCQLNICTKDEIGDKNESDTRGATTNKIQNSDTTDGSSFAEDGVHVSLAVSSASVTSWCIFLIVLIGCAV